MSSLRGHFSVTSSLHFLSAWLWQPSTQLGFLLSAVAATPLAWQMWLTSSMLPRVQAVSSATTAPAQGPLTLVQASYRLLEALRGLLPPPMYLSALTHLAQQQQTLTRRRAWRLLASQAEELLARVPEDGRAASAAQMCAAAHAALEAAPGAERAALALRQDALAVIASVAKVQWHAWVLYPISKQQQVSGRLGMGARQEHACDCDNAYGCSGIGLNQP